MSFWAANISQQPDFPCIVRPKDTGQLGINKGNICIVLKNKSFCGVTKIIHMHSRVQLRVAEGLPVWEITCITCSISYIVECLILFFGPADSVLYKRKVVAVFLQHDSTRSHEKNVYPGGTRNSRRKALIPISKRHGSRRYAGRNQTVHFFIGLLISVQHTGNSQKQV